MPAITLNPGFVCILAALLTLVSPRVARAAIMAGAAVLALWMMLDRDFGAAAAAGQMGLPVVLLDLDALNRIFGIAMLISLIVLAVATGARRSRSEDAAILLMAGGAVSALFVGDLVSFVGAASLAGLAAAWVVFASPLPGAARSGVRLLIWQGLEGLLFLVGVAFHLSAGAASSIFAQLDAASIGGGCIFAALLVRAGAPLAHVWLKDAIAHASPVGAAAISAFSAMLGVYALARLFPAEPALIGVGAAMLAVGLAYAMAEDDLRRAAASGLTAQLGVCIMLIGLGSPLALAAAEGHAFTTLLAFVALQLTLGAVLGRRGTARASAFEGVSRLMPITATLMLAAGLAVSATPLFASYATMSIALEAMAQWNLQWAWMLIASAPAGMLAALCLRPSLAAFYGADQRAPLNEAPFPMLLAAALSVFFCLSIGLAPAWLYGLLPTALTFEPFALDRLAPHLALLGAAGLGFLLLRAFKLAPAEAAVRLRDVDALYRGPLASAGRWLGVVMLRIYGTVQAVAQAQAARAGQLTMRWVRRCDQPYVGSGGALQLGALLAVTAVGLAWSHFNGPGS
jgi:multicomponent Na+:H+ antiporter subunit D